MATSYPTENQPLDDLEIVKLAEQTLKEWDIPGLALTIVHKGKHVKVAGYGVKERDHADCVNTETLFQIASLTKAFTGLTAHMLVEEGKLTWDAPIKTYLSTFKLKDPIATEQMTLADLLSHRTGLPGIAQQEWRLWWHTGRSAEDLMHRLSFLDPAYPFRSHFSYSNMAYIMASKVIANAAGAPWKKVCEDKIFKSLGMHRTSLPFASLSKENNTASAHLLPHLHKESIPWQDCEFGAASGGISSCANDMALWLDYCLSNSSVLKMTQQPYTLIEVDGLFDEFSLPTCPIYTHHQKNIHYGYGWMMYQLAGKMVYFHMGLNDGMQSILAVIPKEQLGVAILTNESPQLGHACLMNILLDRFLQLDEINWHQQAHHVLAELEKSIQERKAHIQTQRKQEKAPTFHPSKYSGEYYHPAYGSIFIEWKDEELNIKLFDQDEGKLEQWGENQFEITKVHSAPPLPWVLDFNLSQDLRQIESFILTGLGVFKQKSVNEL